VLLEQIALELSLPEHYISTVAATASYRYREYVVKGRTGRPRIVHHPARPLKAMQRWLLRRVLFSVPVHDAAMAYEKGRGIRVNAERHRKSRFLLRMDFKGFFPSLTTDDVQETLRRALEKGKLDASWNIDDSALFLSLVCRFGRLVIGAPTSPKLSNAICFELDEQLNSIANRFDVVYTRYADDLFFSTKRANVLSQVETAVGQVISSIGHPKLLKINLSKTRHSSMRGRRVVTGLVLTSDGEISLGRRTKRRLRSQVHKFSVLSDPERMSLRGWLAYCRSIEPEFINSLVVKFGAKRIQEVSR
jgi:RNA-directed DNA polymerase